MEMMEGKLEREEGMNQADSWWRSSAGQTHLEAKSWKPKGGWWVGEEQGGRSKEQSQGREEQETM